MEMKCYEIDSIVKYNGVRLKVVKAVQECRGCYFKQRKLCPVLIVGACKKPWRLENIIFRKYDEHRKENLHSKKNKEK